MKLLTLYYDSGGTPSSSKFCDNFHPRWCKSKYYVIYPDIVLVIFESTDWLLFIRWLRKGVGFSKNGISTFPFPQHILNLGVIWCLKCEVLNFLVRYIFSTILTKMYMITYVCIIYLKVLWIKFLLHVTKSWHSHMNICDWLPDALP